MSTLAIVTPGKIWRFDGDADQWGRRAVLGAISSQLPAIGRINGRAAAILERGGVVHVLAIVDRDGAWKLAAPAGEGAA